MQLSVQLWLSAGGTALAAMAASYAIAACAAVRPRRPTVRRVPGATPPTTILKPLDGVEPELYERLRSFCQQACPEFQIVCGVRDPQDPALEVVRRLQNEFPKLDLQVAANPLQHGNSGKVSNLINMMTLARHDYLVIADSDVRVAPEYLPAIIAPLQEADVGIVTCLYRAYPCSGRWSLLGSLFINEWFMPSVRVATLLGSRSFVSGATLALRRETLMRIGGFEAVVNQLADDYSLGVLTRRLGLRTVLSELEVETCIDEADFAALTRHELRWLRTIRAVQPVGYAVAGVTFAVPAGLLGLLLAGGGAPALVLLAITAVARLMVTSAPRRSLSPFVQLWLVTVSDLLGFALWCWSFTAREVLWRRIRYRVARDGSLRPVP